MYLLTFFLSSAFAGTWLSVDIGIVGTASDSILESSIEVAQEKNHEGVIVFNFGKYQGQDAAKVLTEDRQYYNWMLNKDFSTQVKQLIKKLVKEYNKKD